MDTFGCTLIHYAALGNDAESVRELAGWWNADVNSVCLHLVALLGSLETFTRRLLFSRIPTLTLCFFPENMRRNKFMISPRTCIFREIVIAGVRLFRSEQVY